MSHKVIRKEIDKTDKKILSLLKKRIRLVKTLGKLKSSLEIPIEDFAREKEVSRNLEKQAKKLGLKGEFIKKIFKVIILESKKVQKEV